MPATRTDVHRPASPDFDPESYDLLGVYDLVEPEPWDTQHRLQSVNAMLAQGYSFAGAPHGSRQCSHCGHAPLRYAALMAHEPTKTLLYVGETCLTNRFLDMSKGEFQRLRTEAAARRERRTHQERMAETVELHPLLAWLTYPEVLDNAFLSDLMHQFYRRDLSERQVEAAERAIVRDTERRATQAAREAEAAAKVAAGIRAPEGKTTVEGVIVSVKTVEGQWGVTHKMVVRTDEGWAVWSTVPATVFDAAQDGLRGLRVRFTATLTRSDTDPLFAFAKRPSAAAVLPL